MSDIEKSTLKGIGLMLIGLAVITFGGVWLNAKMEGFDSHFARTEGGFTYSARYEAPFHHVLEMKNKGITIHVVTRKRMLRECTHGQKDTKDDYGKMTPAEWTQACTSYKGDKSDIWIPMELTNITLLHELCHADKSYTAEQCSDMFP